VITKPGLHLMTVLILILFLTGLPTLAAPYRAHSPTPPRPQHPAFPSPQASADLCPPLSPPIGTVVTVSTEAELRDQAYHAAAGTTIVVSPGIYNLGGVVHIVNDNTAIRGATGNRDDVILDGGGMLATGRYHVILIEADDVTVADLTICNGDEHGISVNGSDHPRLYNLHVVDTGYQLVKVNPIGDGSEDGLLACSRLEYSTTSPDCYQGISFGNASHGAGDHTGGIVRNNFIYPSQPHDVVVEMVHASGWLVAHNTALLLGPDGVTHGMEARFPDSSGTFAYNLSNMDIWLDRDGADGTGVGNVTNARSSWFVDASSADLHLVASATDAIDQAATLPEVSDDYDGDSRPHGSAPDVGADEYGPSGTLTHTTYLPLVLNSYTLKLTGQRVYSTDLTYRGAFAYPSGDDWAYSGHALAYYPEGDSSRKRRPKWAPRLFRRGRSEPGRDAGVEQDR